ncbi:MAG: hypothetical protein AAGA25_05115 [Planctomycetota bacterium]
MQASSETTNESEPAPSARIFSRGTSNVLRVVFRDDREKPVLVPSRKILIHGWVTVLLIAGFCAFPTVLKRYDIDLGFIAIGWYVIGALTTILVLAISHVTWFITRSRGPYLRGNRFKGTIDLPRLSRTIQATQVRELRYVTGWIDGGEARSPVDELHLITDRGEVLKVIGGTYNHFRKHARRFAQAMRLDYVEVSVD